MKKINIFIGIPFNDTYITEHETGIPMTLTTLNNKMCTMYTIHNFNHFSNF